MVSLSGWLPCTKQLNKVLGRATCSSGEDDVELVTLVKHAAPEDDCDPFERPVASEDGSDDADDDRLAASTRTWLRDREPAQHAARNPQAPLQSFYVTDWLTRRLYQIEIKPWQVHCPISVMEMSL